MAKWIPHNPESKETAHKVSGSCTEVTPIFKESIALRWAKENRESIAAFNKGIEEHGVWSEGIRSW